MSGVFKAVKKVFKAVVKVVKKIAKPLLIAAAVYFTAGLALSAFPATAGFAASLPGFAGAAGAGTGIFTKIAAKIGLGSLGSSGGLVGGALAKGTSMTALSQAGIAGKAIISGAAKGLTSGVIKGAAAQAASTALGTSGIAAIGAGGSAVGGAVAANSVAGAVNATAAKAGMSLTEKLLLAQGGAKVVGAFLAPTEDEVQAAQKKWRGAFYGMDDKGNTAPAPTPTAPAVQPAAQRQLFTPQAQQQPVTAQVQPPIQRPQPVQTAPAGRSLFEPTDLASDPFKFGVMA